MRRFNFDHSERVLYNKADYPAYVRKGALSAFPNYAAESHWHDDVEFILILSGEMFYNINGEVVLLKEAEGIFVNARQLHFGYSNSKKECIFICLLSHPMLPCSSKSAEQDFINPITQNDNIPFYHFENINDWEKAFSSIFSIFMIFKAINLPNSKSTKRSWIFGSPYAKTSLPYVNLIISKAVTFQP